MTKEEFTGLTCGDIVRHKVESEAIVVHNNYGSHVEAVRTFHLTNPDEWDLMFKAEHMRDAEPEFVLSGECTCSHKRLPDGSLKCGECLMIVRI